MDWSIRPLNAEPSGVQAVGLLFLAETESHVLAAPKLQAIWLVLDFCLLPEWLDYVDIAINHVHDAFSWCQHLMFQMSRYICCAKMEEPKELDLERVQVKYEGEYTLMFVVGEVMEVVREVVLGEGELEVRVKIVDLSQFPQNRYQIGLVEVGFEYEFEWRRIVEGECKKNLQWRNVAD
ncbi:hypothetical protein ACLOJK_028482 [Asimina triloba]